MDAVPTHHRIITGDSRCMIEVPDESVHLVVTSPPIRKEIKEQSRLTTEEWNQFFAGHWNIPGERQDDHLALVPEEIPRRLIRMFSFVEDTVLDPFLGRHSIGYGIHPDFLAVIRRKPGADTSVLPADARFAFVEQDGPTIDFRQKVDHLPYICKDPVPFDNKTDPIKLLLGSRICLSAATPQRKGN